LLHEALRRTLGKHVMQKGSLVSPEKLRFDFSHNKPVEKIEIEKIEKYVNDMVETNAEVKTRIMTPKEAVDKGALAMFGEKYGEEVRVLSIGKENVNYFSTELCGGTHVKNTKEIGKFKIISQSSIAAGIRRIEALRDKQLKEYTILTKKKEIDEDRKIINEIDRITIELNKINIKPKKIENFSGKEKITILNKQLQDEIVNYLLKDKEKNIISDKKIKDGIIRFQKLLDYPTSKLSVVIDAGKKEIKKGIIVSITIFNKKVGIAVGVTNNLTQKYDAVELVKIISEVLDGKGGGGRKDFAQAGGTNVRKIDEAFDILSKKIN
jgi:alanyl-tRNA synthetase